MQYILTAPSRVNCEITLPASKSISNRALVINAMAGNAMPPENLSHCDDTDVMVAALGHMPYEIDIKAAGTAMRFTTAFLAVGDGEHVITGTERMRHRPITVLVEALRTLGADIEYVGEEGFPPLRVKGKKLRGGELCIAGNVSSQYISALLMVGPMMSDGLTLRLTGDIISRPYIDLTISTMLAFGASVAWQGEDCVVVKAQPYKSVPFYIENDWSASSYWYEILTLLNDENSMVSLPGLMEGSRQGDSAIRNIFAGLGVNTKFEGSEPLKPTMVTINAARQIMPLFEYDFINQPDLAQTVVVAAALSGIHFRFSGLQTLRIKETDRIAALKAEMAKLGYVLDDSEEGTLSWNGERCTPMEHPAIDTYEDHRMAMAFAPASIIFPGLIINDPEVVSKSYPHYWDDLKKAGWVIEEMDC